MSDLVPMVLSGEKTSTWRLFDDKNLSVGDELELINKTTGQVFAQARITKVESKKLGELTDADFAGHERFETTQVMYDTYRGYYGPQVNENTEIKMVDFELV